MDAMITLFQAKKCKNVNEKIVSMFKGFWDYFADVVESIYEFACMRQYAHHTKSLW